MAHVQKRTTNTGQTRYAVKYRTPDGKGRSKGGFTNKKAADDYANDIDYNQRRGQTWDPKAGAVTFSSAAEEWLQGRHDLKPRTRAEYANLLSPKVKADPALSIVEVFGGYPLDRITRQRISDWVQRLVAADKKPSTVRHAYFVVRMVLAQAVVDGRLTENPADYVKLPSEHSTNGGAPGVVDDPDQFLSAEQVTALVEATPWPYNVQVHVGAWAGLRAAELAGLQVGEWNYPCGLSIPILARSQALCGWIGPSSRLTANWFTTRQRRGGSRRRVPLTPTTVELLRDYLAMPPARTISLRHCSQRCGWWPKSPHGYAPPTRTVSAPSPKPKTPWLRSVWTKPKRG